MKKIFLTLGAVLAFSLASAQTDPNKATVPQTPPSTVQVETNKAPDKIDVTKDAVTTDPKPQGAVQPRKDEIKTQEHVKSTPKATSSTDTVKAARKTKTKKS